MAPLCYRRHRFPPEIIQHAIWLYLRFTLSYRDVLLNHLVQRDQLRAKTMELARMIAGNNRASVMGIKALLIEQMGQNLEQHGPRWHYTTHASEALRRRRLSPNSSPAEADLFRDELPARSVPVRSLTTSRQARGVRCTRRCCGRAVALA
jgi:hypothetical protein